MKPEVRDGMRIDWDEPVEMEDGVVLRADVFRPTAGGPYPAILSYGPYGKGLSFEEGFKSQWLRLKAAFPEVLEGSSGRYQCWELVDPEVWVPDGYVCVRVDSRGAGRSPGFLEIFSEREALDLYHCVEWAGTRPWSNGRVGLNGISYYAMMAWLVGPLNPPHLSAVCAWEGSCDYYRELSRHGGILSDFVDSWYRRQVLSVQHGVGERGPRSPNTGELVSGPPTLPEKDLQENRADAPGEILARSLLDDYYRSRLPKLEHMRVPLLSAGNWGGHGLHLRGNLEGFVRAGSEEKWLEVHGDTHFSHFYSSYGLDLQKRFFGHFLKQEDTGWDQQPRVTLNIRRPGESFALRAEDEWPLARTKWTNYFLHPSDLSLSTERLTEEAVLTYSTTGSGITFSTAPLTDEIEITGPVAAKLWISSDKTDTDLFLVLRVFDPDDREVVFVGANDPRSPVALGWLRASHRKLDTARSFPHRPFHAHDELWPLSPGRPVELDIEIWPTCIVVPPDHRIALTIRGTDYEYDGTDAAVPHAAYPMKGVGPFTHTNRSDRASTLEASLALHFGGDMSPYLLLPVIPPK